MRSIAVKGWTRINTRKAGESGEDRKQCGSIAHCSGACMTTWLRPSPCLRVSMILHTRVHASDFLCGTSSSWLDTMTATTAKADSQRGGRWTVCDRRRANGWSPLSPWRCYQKNRGAESPRSFLDHPPLSTAQLLQSFVLLVAVLRPAATASRANAGALLIYDSRQRAKVEKGPLDNNCHSTGCRRSSSFWTAPIVSIVIDVEPLLFFAGDWMSGGHFNIWQWERWRSRGSVFFERDTRTKHCGAR